MKLYEYIRLIHKDKEIIEMFKGMNPNLIVLWFVYFVFLTYYLFYSEELVSLYPLTLKSIIEEKQMGIDTCPVILKLSEIGEPTKFGRVELCTSCSQAQSSRIFCFKL